MEGLGHHLEEVEAAAPAGPSVLHGSAFVCSLCHHWGQELGFCHETSAEQSWGFYSFFFFFPESS